MGVLRHRRKHFRSTTPIGNLADWPFNAVDLANDVSGNGNHGVVIGAVLGVDDDSYDFDGAGDGIACMGTQAFPTEGSIAFKFTPQGGFYDNCFCNNNGSGGTDRLFRFERSPDDTALFYIGYTSGSKSVSTTTVFSNGSTYEVVCTWSIINSRIRVYVNKTLEGTTLGIDSPPENFVNFSIGKGILADQTRDYDGLMHWAKMWNYEVDQSIIDLL